MGDDRCSEAIAVGSFGVKAIQRDVIEADGSYTLREPAEAYALEFEVLRLENSFFGMNLASLPAFSRSDSGISTLETELGKYVDDS